MFERFTEGARKVVGLAQEEAGRLRHDFVDTEHLLLGLLREEEGVAARVLLNLDVDPDAVRREVVRRLPGGEPGPSDETGRRIEERQGDMTLFRGRVVVIRAELAVPRPVTVDADYAYRVPVEPAAVADLIRTGLQEADSPILETIIETLGEERWLYTFPAMLEVSVSASGAPEPADPPTPTFSVSATFRR